MNGLKFEFLDPVIISRSPCFSVVESFLRRTSRTEIGWHYIIDLAWIFSCADKWPRSYTVLDAGGGRGPAQFLLAEMGFNVVNVDLTVARADTRFQARYDVRHAAPGSMPECAYAEHLENTYTKNATKLSLRNVIESSAPARLAARYLYGLRHDRWRRESGQADYPVGHLRLVQADLSQMPEIESASFDAVVSLSSLEHVPLDRLPSALDEINRTLKPDAQIAMTTSATHLPTTWFHGPSQGYCFSSDDLAELFQAQNASLALAHEVLQQYRQSKYLRDKLASFYRSSGDNGMPWGVWDPAYFPVGLWR